MNSKAYMKSYQAKYQPAYYQLNKEKINAKRITDRRLRCQQNFMEFIKERLYNAKGVDRRKGIDSDLNLDFLLNLLVQQDYRCAISGIYMTHRLRDPHGLSIDRIDSTRPHTCDNVQLVALFFQHAKMDKDNQGCVSIIREIEINLLKRLRDAGRLIL